PASAAFRERSTNRSSAQSMISDQDGNSKLPESVQSLCASRRLLRPTICGKSFEVIEFPRQDYLRATLCSDNFHEFLHSISALLQCHLFLSCQLDLDDLFQATCSELARHTDKQTFDSILSL